MTTQTQIHPRIAIVGGGPSGLVLLLTLHRRGIPATLYERDETPFARQHLGGILDLGWESGQRALRENGLQDAFDANSRTDAQAMNFYDKDGNLVAAIPADPNQSREKSRPEIDRSILRKILLDAVPAESIKWDHALTSVRAVGDGTHELTFANGTTAVCDILIGADGGHSRVRPLVSSATPIYYGVNGAEISLAPQVTARPEFRDVVDAVGAGSVFVPNSGTFFGCQRNGDGRIRAYLWLHESVDWTLPTDPAEARRVLLERYEGWAPWMRKFIAHCDDEAIYQRRLFYLPVDHRWTHVPGVTLVGDAAHLGMPAGQGANLAMLDGLQLGLVLADAINGGKSAEEREAAVAVWEEAMFEKCARVGAESMKNFGMLVNSDPHALLARAKEMDESEESKDS